MNIDEARKVTRDCTKLLEEFDDNCRLLETEDGMMAALVFNSSVVAIVDIRNKVLVNVKCKLTRLMVRYYNDLIAMCDMVPIVRKIIERENFSNLAEFMTNIERIDVKNGTYKPYK